MEKYILIPGYIRSTSDKAIHWISASQLVDLYKVDPAECVFPRPGYLSGRHNCQLIPLHPQSSGNYSLPEAPEAEPTAINIAKVEGK